MSAQFTIQIDPALNLVRTRMTGFYSVDDIAAFRAARTREFAKLTCGPNRHLSVTDLREMKIQSQEIVGEFQRLLAEPRYRSHRLAFVVASTLARMQLMRAIGERSDVRCFLDPAEAEAWVLSGDALAA